jgi:CRP-like cAMP-binding protein
VLEGTVSVHVINHDDPTGDLIEISRVGPGDSFGERALLQDIQRGASVLCETTTHFATLSKSAYTRILGKLH